MITLSEIRRWWEERGRIRWRWREQPHEQHGVRGRVGPYCCTEPDCKLPIQQQRSMAESPKTTIFFWNGLFEFNRANIAPSTIGINICYAYERIFRVFHFKQVAWMSFRNHPRAYLAGFFFLYVLYNRFMRQLLNILQVRQIRAEDWVDTPHNKRAASGIPRICFPLSDKSDRYPGLGRQHSPIILYRDAGREHSQVYRTSACPHLRKLEQCGAAFVTKRNSTLMRVMGCKWWGKFESHSRTYSTKKIFLLSTGYGAHPRYRRTDKVSKYVFR